MKRRTHKIFSPSGWMLAACMAVMLSAVVLFTTNSYASWGFIVVLLCPLMHIFMHRHLHSGSGHHGQSDAQLPRETGKQR